MNFFRPKTINLLFSVALCFVTAPATQGLAQSRPSPIERRVEQMDRQREQYERDTLRDGKPQKPTDQKQSQAIILQVKHDLERIQSVYNEIVLAMSANTVLDHKLILDATGEIKKCAARLKKNLALPEPDDKGNNKVEVELKEDQINPSLRKLCRHIASFVTNPLFETPGVLDIEQSTKASKDLLEIIELSDVVWRSTNKLGGAKH